MILVAVGNAAKALVDNDPSTVPSWEVTITAVMAGIGLIVAKDATVGGTGTVPP